MRWWTREAWSFCSLCPDASKPAPTCPLVQVGITLIPSAFQRALALPKEVLRSFAGAALDHLRSTSDAARKNGSVFFGSALLQPEVLKVFDEAEGLKKLLAAVKASRLMLKQPQGQELPRQEKQVEGQQGAFAGPLCMKD